MDIKIFTIFPEMFDGPLNSSLLGKAREKGILDIDVINFRDYSTDKHKAVDDTPYGGGKGMLLSPVPVCACYDAVKALAPAENCRTIYLSPKGKVLTQKKAAELAGCDRLILLCGHYEGIDERAIEEIGAEELSIGDYVLTGGELAACVLIDCVGRLVAGVLADAVCHEEESIVGGLLEYPQYTRPENFRGREVPAVLLEGNHREIRKWRYLKALEQTKKKRPDLL